MAEWATSFWRGETRDPKKPRIGDPGQSFEMQSTKGVDCGAKHSTRSVIFSRLIKEASPNMHGTFWQTQPGCFGKCVGILFAQASITTHDVTPWVF
jgi:hypothetical protein